MPIAKSGQCTKGKLGQHAAAIVDYDTASTTQNPMTPTTTRCRGDAKAEVRTILRRNRKTTTPLSVSNPDYALAYYSCRGQCKRQDLGQHSDAIKDYNAAIRLEPNAAYYSAYYYSCRGQRKG